MRRTIVFIFGGMILGAGCAGLNSRMASVSFEDPLTRLGIVNVPSNAEEQAGLVLRLLPPAVNQQHSTEETTIYSGVQGDQGSLIKLIQHNTETYRPGSRPDTYIIRTESFFQGLSGSILDELEVTRRGEIVKLILGKHDAKDGKFTITSWTRTPVFPENAVKTGDRWSYEESMALQLDSFWIKQTGESPYTIKAASRFAGFAEVKGRRCAAIETSADQIQTERFKVFFKGITLYIRAKIQETVYLDYKTGTAIARIAKIRSYTNSADSSVNDYSISQTVSYLDKNAETER